jgi:hypothetical protein
MTPARFSQLVATLFSKLHCLLFKEAGRRLQQYTDSHHAV